MWNRGTIAVSVSLVALLAFSGGAYSDGYHDFVGYLMLLLLAMLVAVVVWFCASVIVEAEVYRRVLKWPRGHAWLHSLLANIAAVGVFVGLWRPVEWLTRSAGVRSWVLWWLLVLSVLAMAMTVIEVGVLMLLNRRFAPRRRLIGVVAGVNAATIGTALLVVVGGLGALEYASNQRYARFQEARKAARAPSPMPPWAAPGNDEDMNGSGLETRPTDGGSSEQGLVHQAFPAGTLRPDGLPPFLRCATSGVGQGKTAPLALRQKWCVIWRTEPGVPAPVGLTAVSAGPQGDGSRIEIKPARPEQGDMVGVSEIVSQRGLFEIEVEADGKWWIEVLSY